MPSAKPDSLQNQFSKLIGLERELAPMSRLIAAPAGSDDIGCPVGATIASRLQVFRSALQVSRRADRDSMSRRQRLRPVQPHLYMAVVTAPGLTLI
jgi:hypothetical protein